MSQLSTQINDQKLREMLEQSALEFDQIMQIAPLISHLNDQEKNELAAYIKQANELAEEQQKVEESYRENLQKLNEDYDQKSETLIRKNTSDARKAYENLHQHEVDIEADLDKAISQLK